MSAAQAIHEMPEQLSVKIDNGLAADLETFRERQTFKPDKSEVVRQALREYLDRELAEE